ncbi:MAG: phosphoglycerate dehydrogenase, partial [Sphingobacteriales bacterium]
HTPSVPEMQHFINRESLEQCKPGVIIINYARGEMVDLEALREAILNKKVGGAAIDVFPTEPEKNGDQLKTPLQGLDNVLLTPHIGGSTEEAQVNIGIDVSDKLISFIETGNTQGSLTIPALTLTMQENAHRILHIHRNIPGVLSEINTTLARNGINILGQYLRTNESVGYVVLDISEAIASSAFDLLKEVKGTIRVRILY